jgi:hypothetical protein
VGDICQEWQNDSYFFTSPETTAFSVNEVLRIWHPDGNSFARILIKLVPRCNSLFRSHSHCFNRLQTNYGFTQPLIRIVWVSLEVNAASAIVLTVRKKGFYIYASIIASYGIPLLSSNVLSSTYTIQSVHLDVPDTLCCTLPLPRYRVTHSLTTEIHLNWLLHPRIASVP